MGIGTEVMIERGTLPRITTKWWIGVAVADSPPELATRACMATNPNTMAAPAPCRINLRLLHRLFRFAKRQIDRINVNVWRTINDGNRKSGTVST
jgi:hypothetical protein